MVFRCDHEFRIGLHDDLAEGSYVATHRVTSADGHVIRGRIPFSVSASAAGAAVSSERPCASGDDEHAH